MGRIESWMDLLDQYVKELTEKGAEQIDYINVSIKLGVSTTYARELMRVYATKYNLTYEHGVLKLERGRADTNSG